MNTIKRPSARLTRWIDEFQMYDLGIRYRPGVKVTVPDASTSRLPGGERERDRIEYVEHMEEYLMHGRGTNSTNSSE